MTFIQDRHKFAALTLSSSLFHYGYTIMGHVWYVSETFYDLMIWLFYRVCCLWMFFMNVAVNVCWKGEFIIYYVVWMRFQSLIEYITFQTALANYNMINKVVLKNKYTFNSWQKFFTPYSACCSSTVRTWFSDCKFSITPPTTSNFVCKIFITLQTKLEVERGVVEELQSLNQVLIVKEQNVDKELKISCQALNMNLFF